MVMTGATTMGLLDIARLRPDDVVLVTSAAGGIGRLVVQYAHALGATVVGAAGGPDKTEAVRALGADVAVDYDRPGWQETVRELLAERGITHVNALLELIAHPEEGPAREREALEAAAKGEWS